MQKPRCTRHDPSANLIQDPCLTGSLGVIANDSRNNLMVSDNAEQCNVLANLVNDIGHLPFTATDGQMALQIFQERRIDLEITDVKMPRMDGMALLGRIHQADPAERAIVITGFTSSKTILRTIEGRA